jgi:hypothetical protein
MLKRVDHLNVQVPPEKEEEAKRFYGEILGISRLTKQDYLGRSGAHYCLSEEPWYELDLGSRVASRSRISGSIKRIAVISDSRWMTSQPRGWPSRQQELRLARPIPPGRKSAIFIRNGFLFEILGVTSSRSWNPADRTQPVRRAENS